MSFFVWVSYFLTACHVSRSGLQTVDAVTVQQSADVIAVQKRLGVQSGMVFAVPIPHEYDLGSCMFCYHLGTCR